MQQRSAALEYEQFAILDRESMVERLLREMIGLPSLEWDRSYRTGKPSFPAYPSERRSRTDPRGGGPVMPSVAASTPDARTATEAIDDGLVR